MTKQVKKEADFFIHSDLVCKSIGDITPELCCSGSGICVASEGKKLKELLDAKNEPENG